MSFFDEFNHIVPYFVNINIGRNRQFKTDLGKRCSANHKGKMVAFYHNVKTLQEIQKYGLNGYMTYLPAQRVSMPIDIHISSDADIYVNFEKTCKYTREQKTHHCIRIYNSDGKQIGYVSLNLSASGDIDEKTCFYQTPDRSEIIRHSIYNQIRYGELTKDDVFQFEKSDETKTKTVEFVQRAGKIIGASVIEKESEIQKEQTSVRLETDVAFCATSETERSKSDEAIFPGKCIAFEKTLFKDSHTLQQFKGDYIGNILRLTNTGYQACIVTKHQKAKQNYRLYTLVDLPKKNMTQGTNHYYGNYESHNCHEQLKSADKTPTFVTRLGKDEKEQIVLYKGHALSGECPEYSEFVKNYITPFKEIKPIQIDQFLNRGKQK